MSTQNNIQMFITLHDIRGNWFELNPAYIVIMQRGYDGDGDNALPITKLQLTTGTTIEVIQTPEEISDQQMGKMGELMQTIFATTQKMMANAMDDDEDYF